MKLVECLKRCPHSQTTPLNILQCVSEQQYTCFSHYSLLGHHGNHSNIKIHYSWPKWNIILINTSWWIHTWPLRWCYCHCFCFNCHCCSALWDIFAGTAAHRWLHVCEICVCKCHILKMWFVKMLWHVIMLCENSLLVSQFYEMCSLL